MIPIPEKSPDLYLVLGVEPSATAAEIKSAYRRRAKRLHPDNRPGDRELEDDFKRLAEAYAVLSDEVSRRAYDLQRDNRQSSLLKAAAAMRDKGERAESWSGFGEFVGGFFRRGETAGADPRDRETGPVVDEKPREGARRASAVGFESELSVSLEDAYSGASRRVTLAIREKSPLGRSRTRRRELEVKIPPGVHDGQCIRLKARTDGLADRDGDVYLRIHIERHSVFSFEGKDLAADLVVTPWEAALGQEVQAPTLDGPVLVKLPVGLKSGRRVRLRGRGYPKKAGGPPGDLFLRVLIAVPKELTPEERALFSQLSRISRFRPREQS
jgi:curved DNA-binding protein